MLAIARARNNAEIASDLSIEESTVKTTSTASCTNSSSATVRPSSSALIAAEWFVLTDNEVKRYVLRDSDFPRRSRTDGYDPRLYERPGMFARSQRGDHPLPVIHLHRDRTTVTLRSLAKHIREHAPDVPVHYVDAATVVEQTRLRWSGSADEFSRSLPCCRCSTR